MFSPVDVPFYISTNSAQMFQFLHILTNTYCLFIYLKQLSSSVWALVL